MAIKLIITVSIVVNLFTSCQTEKNELFTASEQETIKKVRTFIKENWIKTIRYNPDDSSTLIGLPKPYTVPCISDAFQEMYYWDTYWTNKGLIVDGNIEQAKNNCENILFLIEKYGQMLNGNRTFYQNRSQSPLFCMMVMDVFRAGSDTLWLKKCLPGLEKEYSFWMTKRNTPIGLNRFSNNGTNNEKLEFFSSASQRLGPNFDTSRATIEEKLKIGSHLISECESWDFNPRYDTRCEDFCPVDLNCYLYIYEKELAYVHRIFNDPDSARWLDMADTRKALINKYMYNPEDDLFYDYDFVNHRQSKIYSAAIFHILWSEVANELQAKAIVDNLPKIEFNYGISTCAPGIRNYSYQWDYPNGWAPIQHIAVEGLQKYGYHSDSRRIASKFIKAMILNFEKTQNLWEKYNVVDGSINVTNEYEMPPMMGWTAGVFAFLSDNLDSSAIDGQY